MKSQSNERNVHDEFTKVGTTYDRDSEGGSCQDRDDSRGTPGCQADSGAILEKHRIENKIPIPQIVSQ